MQDEDEDEKDEEEVKHQVKNMCASSRGRLSTNHSAALLPASIAGEKRSRLLGPPKLVPLSADFSTEAAAAAAKQAVATARRRPLASRLRRLPNFSTHTARRRRALLGHSAQRHSLACLLDACLSASMRLYLAMSAACERVSLRSPRKTSAILEPIANVA